MVASECVKGLADLLNDAAVREPRGNHSDSMVLLRFCNGDRCVNGDLIILYLIASYVRETRYLSP